MMFASNFMGNISFCARFLAAKIKGGNIREFYVASLHIFDGINACMGTMIC